MFRNIKWPEDERPYPKLFQCSGGWFAVHNPGDLGSGPWKNEQAAEFALEGEYEKANEANQ
jgi:hypothetical protein